MLELCPRSYRSPVRKKIGRMIPIFRLKLFQAFYPLAWFHLPRYGLERERCFVQSLRYFVGYAALNPIPRSEEVQMELRIVHRAESSPKD
jgi:hypothetical protein